MDIWGMKQLQIARLQTLEEALQKLKERSRASITKSVVKAEVDIVKTIWNYAVKTDSEIMSGNYDLKHAYFSNNIFVRINKVFGETYDFLLSTLKERDGRSEAKTTEKKATKRPSSEIHKLPKLKVPFFSGGLNENWKNFRNLFKKLVHDVEGIDDETRLLYLNSYLKGNASNEIYDIKIDKGNYGAAWKRLKLRYDRPYATLYKYLNAIMEMEPITEDSPGKLRAIADEIEYNMLNLKCLKVPIENWDLIIIHILKRKLDESSLMEWEGLLQKKEYDYTTESFEQDMTAFFPTLQEFITFLKNRAQTLTLRKTTFFFENGDDGLENSTRITCPFCYDFHVLPDCPDLLDMTPPQRKIVKKVLKIYWRSHESRLPGSEKVQQVF